jgi:hypothetical protein
MLASRSLARLLELSLAGADAAFSDNYFDLPAGWAPAQPRAALRLCSVYDSYGDQAEG